MSSKPFASSADLAEKQETLEILADGVYALTAEGDPNVGAVEGEDFLVCFEARATPVAAREWLGRLREHTDKPVRYLVLSHYHAVRVLGASAFAADAIVAHENTRALVAERGKQDWESELGRMPRLFKDPASIPGLTCTPATPSTATGRRARLTGWPPSAPRRWSVAVVRSPAGGRRSTRRSPRHGTSCRSCASRWAPSTAAAGRSRRRSTPPTRRSPPATAAGRSSSTPCRSTSPGCGTSWTASSGRGSGPPSATVRSGTSCNGRRPA